MEAIAINEIQGELLVETLLDRLPEGILLCKQREDDLKIIYANKCAYYLLNVDTLEQESFFEIINNETSLYELLDNETVNVRTNNRHIELLHINIEDEYFWLILHDNTYVKKLERESNKVSALNQELRAVFEKFEDENIMITDEKGIILSVGDEILKTCGITKEKLIGMSVYEAEAKKLFFPSVTKQVIETLQSQVIIQNTKNGIEVISIGVPLFDMNGNIEKVVSVTKDFSSQLKISSMLAKYGEGELFSKDNYNNTFEDDFSIVTCEEKMFYIKWLIRLVAPTSSTILLSGETGTGKSLFAEYIYRLSERYEKPFIKINCGAISPKLVESELFGYEGGSFTGAKKEGKKGLIEAANGGTLFLDEISELPINQQVKLLHVLQEKTLTRVGGNKQIELDIRIIAATNKDLEKLVKHGKFRQDLYYRLNVVSINIPPLRDRKNDIPLFIKYFLKKYNIDHKKMKRLSRNCINILQEYSWPGNVRELENTIENLVVTNINDLIEHDSLPDRIRNITDKGSTKVEINEIMSLSDAIKETEKSLIIKALNKYKTATRVAEVLDVNQSTISRKMKQYGLNFESNK